MPQIEFDWSIGDLVSVKSLDITGTVIGLYCGDGNEKQILVEYADSTGKVHSKYFGQNRIARRPQGESVSG